ncbi:hypothetical protein STCU_06132 [Strigomonas culicis]|uniref:J domain-containing protein n=1 Tax=Strigomonas culicis TaxID=28005 RepID=S9UCP6_9TRYP|nr:hypothetical protein STCU_06132 [Strigomonas culicis]|eukprot:EPY26683.1 hypothetical protein STCU_06132 [Strigomonas culicis]
MFCFSRRRLALPRGDDLVAAFKVLGLRYSPHLPPAAQPSAADVRRQYRELARLHHPDLSSGDDQRMKVVNTAYELIQSSGVLRALHKTSGAAGAEAAAPAGTATEERFRRRAGSRRKRVPDDFASGDGMSWSMRSTLDWQRLMQSTEGLTAEELKNPANHPFSHSKFFTFQDDLTIYRMIRGGATVPQVARTLGKTATFIERRLHNAQFKQRVQYVLRRERGQDPADPTQRPLSTVPPKQAHRRQQQQADAQWRKGSSRRTGEHDAAQQWTAAEPLAENTLRSALHHAPLEPHPHMQAGGHGLRGGAAAGRKREWQPSYPEWNAPEYFADLTLEEKGMRAGLTRDRTAEARERESHFDSRHYAASKIGKSYANYARLHGRKRP